MVFSTQCFHEKPWFLTKTASVKKVLVPTPYQTPTKFT